MSSSSSSSKLLVLVVDAGGRLLGFDEGLPLQRCLQRGCVRVAGYSSLFLLQPRIPAAAAAAAAAGSAAAAAAEGGGWYVRRGEAMRPLEYSADAAAVFVCCNNPK